MCLVLVLQLFVSHVKQLFCVTKDYVRKEWKKLLNDEFYDFRKCSLGGPDEGECGGISVSSAEGMSHQPIQKYVALFQGHR